MASLELPPIGIGCAALGSMPETFGYETPEEQGLELVRQALDGPFRFLDTAGAYGDGESERRIGVVLRERGGLPPGFLLTTKADRDLHTGDFSGDQMRRSIERSLGLLGLSRLGLVFLHDPEHTTFEATMATDGAVPALHDLKRQGVISHLGIAAGPIPLLIQYVETDLFDAIITHNRYTLLNRTAEPLLDLAQRKNIPLLNAAPYGSGLLAKGPREYPRYAYTQASPELLDKATRMEELCAQDSVPLAAAALHFSMRDPRVASTIVGMTKPERIAQTEQLVNTQIPDELWPKLDALMVSGADPEARRWQ